MSLVARNDASLRGVHGVAQAHGLALWLVAVVALRVEAVVPNRRWARYSAPNEQAERLGSMQEEQFGGTACDQRTKYLNSRYCFSQGEGLGGLGLQPPPAAQLALKAMTRKAPASGVCRLCGRACLLRNSHIIPEFLYKGLYDDIHRALRITTNSGSNRLLQKGIREHLLCGPCESGLGELERRVSEGWALPSQLTNRTYDLEIATYAELKLLFLSILWRASVSTLPAFSNVFLGDYETDVHQRLLNGDPGLSTDFPISGRLLRSPNDQCRFNCIATPALVNDNGLDGWLFVTDGLAWMCFPRNNSLALGDGALPEVGRWRVPVLEFTSLKALERWS
jgi:hypothetical protein